MKKVIPVLLLLLITIYQCNAQNLVNSKKDTLGDIAFYNSTLKDKREFQFTLESALYFFILDVGVDQDSLTLDINRPYDSPILYRKHNGHYAFEIQNSSVVTFNIDNYITYCK